MEGSSTFHIPVTFGDGTEGEYVLIGEEGRIGFLVGSGKREKQNFIQLLQEKIINICGIYGEKEKKLKEH
ncbi:hypothetical protein ACERII_22750 [Evansella sp. AB-rgal1]|uniref:hypothetical protein n=1 Tax=Evansella sp. AB-rgal1 TaxID=3242696 RepID=UPI00359CF917